MVVLALVSGAGWGAAEVYVASVPMRDEPPGPQASVLYYSDGKTILARVGTADHNDVPLSAVPAAVRHAVLAAEDRDFADHGGVSVRGVLRAIVSDLKGGHEGASTITQQFARNAYLTQDFSVDRKAREMAIAVKLERRYSKDEILERYLNTIYFGRGAYGIAAAANAYFGVRPDQLTPAQGVVLAAVIKDPYHFDPAVDARAAKNRFLWIAKAAAEAKWLPTGLTYPAVTLTRTNVGGKNGVVVDQIENELKARGISSQDLHTKGLSVVTTLDRVAQPAAVQQVTQQLQVQPAGLRGALVALDPRSGAVRAYFGSDQGRGYYDYATAPHPAASTFKPIVLSAALERGIGYNSRWDGSSPRIFPGRQGVPLKNHANAQCPNCTLETAMVESLNTPFYAVTEELGADAVRSMAVRLGIPDAYAGQRSMVDVKGDPKPGRTRPDISIGRYPVAPADLATVYATFASGGTHYDRYFVEKVSAADHRELYQAVPVGEVVLKPGVAADVSTVLSSVVRRDGVSPKRPAAGKTGTQAWGDTKENQDAWMAGYTPELATTIWLGKEKPGPLRDAAGKPIEGETLPAKMWQAFTTASLHGAPVEALPPPANVGRTDVGDAGRSKPSTGTKGGIGAKPLGPDVPVIHTAHAGKRLALTFDDGPSEFTPAMLDLLKQYHIKGVFCMVGEEVEQHPDLVKRVVSEGHGLCNHSWKHDDLGALSEAAARADIQRTQDALAKAAPGRTVSWFRAPFGSWGASAKAGAAMHMTPLGWVVDPDDWTTPGADVIRTRIKEQLEDRAVVLVHDGGGDRSQTVTALKKLIPELLADGWTFDLPEKTVAARPLPHSNPPKEQPEQGVTEKPAPPVEEQPPVDPVRPEVIDSAPPGDEELRDQGSPQKSRETGKKAPGTGA
ncbi:transglycosylase domain-containing protein [Actinoplanes sp. NPDC049265]|uniref:transglycosylase domain-containing protein n=1 Tax=Actinoplanes sp. NPDC049265 TaxID=3363902 RepID=UPI00371E1D68